MKPLIVTLDGPAGVGKTTLAKRVAQTLGIAYLDTGAMFRCLALHLGEEALALDAHEVEQRARQYRFRLAGSGATTKLYCNEQEIGQEIRTEAVGLLASRFAAVACVREVLKEAQRALGEKTSLVVEGRDMGTVIFPQAAFKFFLDASPRVRAQRRLLDLHALGQEAQLDELEASIRERDERDRNRLIAPLKPAEDAVLVDTSALTIEGVLQSILEAISAKQIVLEHCQGVLNACRQHKPLVHFITNYVTVNDCANITIACGASPIMADDPKESSEISALCKALVLNMGTLCERTLTGMLKAAEAAHAHGHPVILDPVGAGASSFRNASALMLLKEAKPQIIKGNISEIRFLAEGVSSTQGVDAAASDLTTKDSLRQHAALAQDLAKKLACVIVISGALDIVASADAVYAISNGSARMGEVSGTGCMAAAILGGFAGASPQNPLGAALAAMAAIGIAGELAAQRAQGLGSASYRIALIDSVSTIDEQLLAKAAKIQRVL